jgi:hypothetical protein
VDSTNGTNSNPTDPAEQEQAITAASRELAYDAWAHYRRELDQDTSRERFEQAFMGHYSTIDGYAIQLVDDYNLDAKLDRLIGEPFRRHVDIDIPGFGRALISSAAIYTLQAVPVGVWVFMEID